MWCFHKFNQKEQHRSSFCSCKLTSSRAFLSTYLLPAFDNPIVYAWSEQQQKRPALVSIHWFCWVQYRLLIFWNMTLQHGRKAFRRRTADRLAAPSDFSNWGKLRFLLLSGLIYFCMSLLSFLCVILKVTVMTRCFKRTLTLLWVQAVAAPFDKKHWTSFLFALTILDLNLRWQRLAGISTGHLRNLPAQSRATYSQLLRTTARKLLVIPGDLTSSLSNLCQSWFTLTVKTLSLCSDKTFQMCRAGAKPQPKKPGHTKQSTATWAFLTSTCQNNSQ